MAIAHNLHSSLSRRAAPFFWRSRIVLRRAALATTRRTRAAVRPTDVVQKFQEPVAVHGKIVVVLDCQRDAVCCRPIAHLRVARTAPSHTACEPCPACSYAVKIRTTGAFSSAASRAGIRRTRSAFQGKAPPPPAQTEVVVTGNCPHEIECRSTRREGKLDDWRPHPVETNEAACRPALPRRNRDAQSRDELQQLQTVLPPKPGVADREQTKFHGFIHLPIVTTRLKRHLGEVVCRYDDVELADKSRLRKKTRA